MSSEPTKKETSAPVTAAKSGRGSSEAYSSILRQMNPHVQPSFIQQIETHISSERLQAYAVPLDPDPKVTLARYMLNMALCESLYPSLQNCEIALRKAKAKIQKQHKPITAGRVVSELQFGFWTSLFEAHYEQNTAFLPSGIKTVFPHLPKSLHKRKDRKNDLEHIRNLRNRVFHHERIVHWKDLDAQHELILQVIGWLSPELRQMTSALERFGAIRKEGLTPFLTHAMWDTHQDLGARV